MDDALRMDDDLDRVVVDIVQPVRLDDLQALVRERRRVDRDLRAHRPGRVAEGLLRVTVDEVRRAVEERAARCRQDQRRDPRHRLADEALPDRRVLRVDRAEPGERARERIARGRRRALRRHARARAASRDGRPATSVSLLAVATTLPASSAARTGRRLTIPPVRDDDEVDVVAGREVRQRRRRLGADDGVAGPEASRLLGQQRARSSPAREGDDCGMRPDGAARTSSAWRPIEPGRAEDARPVAAGPVSGSGDDIEVTTGAANRNESTRSRIPPWPGISVPESFAPAARLSIDSARSPAWAARASERPEDQRAAGAGRGPTSTSADTTVAATIPPISPAYVFDGEMWVRNCAARTACRRVGAGVVGPDREHEEDDPAALGAEDRERRAVGTAARRGRAAG